MVHSIDPINHYEHSIQFKYPITMMHSSTNFVASSNIQFTQIHSNLNQKGGLYIPDHIPTLDLLTILSWKNLPFNKLAFEIMRLFIDENEIDNNDLLEILTHSFTSFTHPETTPLVTLPNNFNEQVWILELFHVIYFLPLE